MTEATGTASDGIAGETRREGPDIRRTLATLVSDLGRIAEQVRGAMQGSGQADLLDDLIDRASGAARDAVGMVASGDRHDLGGFTCEYDAETEDYTLFWPDGRWLNVRKDQTVRVGRSPWRAEEPVVGVCLEDLRAFVATGQGERTQADGEDGAVVPDEVDPMWATVVGQGAYVPGGSGIPVRHIHPTHVKTVFDAVKGTATADVIVGLLFRAVLDWNRVRRMSSRIAHLQDELDELRTEGRHDPSRTTEG